MLMLVLWPVHCELGLSYQLLLEGDLLQLHLVDASLGGANKRRGGNQSALHIGRRLEIDDVVWEMGWDGWRMDERLIAARGEKG